MSHMPNSAGPFLGSTKILHNCCLLLSIMVMLHMSSWGMLVLFYISRTTLFLLLVSSFVTIHAIELKCFGVHNVYVLVILFFLVYFVYCFFWCSDLVFFVILCFCVLSWNGSPSPILLLLSHKLDTLQVDVDELQYLHSCACFGGVVCCCDWL